MSKFVRISITLTCIFFLASILFVSQANTVTNYYSNNFESTSALDDGYWSSQGAEIQTINNSNVLKVSGEASFKPEQGNYALDNFTVQFDVWHDVRYENNTAYAGPFYQATDSENNIVIMMGYVQRGTNDILVQTGFVNLNAGGPSGETSHYYFPFDHSAEWSTWRLTATIAAIDNTYFANITVQINNETVTAFTNDREQTVSDITNEWIINPVSHHNLLPLPQPGVVVPTYAPTYYSDSGIHYDFMSNNQAKPVYSLNGATPSYIDNFYYGYAGTVPLSVVPTPTPIQSEDISNRASSTPGPTSTITQHPTINTGPEPPQTESFPTTLAVVLILSIVVFAIGVLAYFNKRKRSSISI